jgi:hypothetical protein
MGKLSTALKAVLAAQFVPKLARAVADTQGQSTAIHYRPLNGTACGKWPDARCTTGQTSF